MQAVLFAKCLGLNDSRSFGTVRADPRSGSTELTDALNLTTTPDGCLEKIAPLVTELTHSAPVTNVSAKHRFIYQDGIDVKEWNGTNTATIGAIMAGPVAHTPIDVRVSQGSTVYKSTAAGSALLIATGDTSAIPATSNPFYVQPAFTKALAYNGLLYGINFADPRFLQYSVYTHFDVWALGDNHIGHIDAIRDFGAIPGQLLTAHDSGVTIYVGTNPADFRKTFFPCKIINNTLYSGYIEGLDRDRHIFLCDDGIYMVSQNGDVNNLVDGTADYLSTRNTVYYAATVQGSKYLAFGDVCCIEYDFVTKTMLKRSNFGVISATRWNKQAYFATGSTIKTIGSTIDTSSAFGCSLTLPFSNFGAQWTKSLESFYFTGTATGGMEITATDNMGKTWTVEVSDELTNVSRYRIKTPKGMLGNHISLNIACTSGAFRLEELTATFSASQRSK